MKAVRYLCILASITILGAVTGCDSSSSKANTGTMPTGAIGEWLFAGNANDTSGNEDNGSSLPSSQLTSDRNGVNESAYNFATSTFIQLAQSDLLQLYQESFSISVWVKSSADTQTDNAGIISKYHATGTCGYFIRVKEDGRINIGAAQDISTTDSILVKGEWQHLVWTYDYGTYKSVLYVNGHSVALSDDSVEIGVANNTDSLMFGVDYYTDGARYFNGAIDDIRIYDKVLTADEALGLYNE